MKWQMRANERRGLWSRAIWFFFLAVCLCVCFLCQCAWFVYVSTLMSRLEIFIKAPLVVSFPSRLQFTILHSHSAVWCNKHRQRMAMDMAHSRRSCTAERPSGSSQTTEQNKIKTKNYKNRERLLNFKHHILNADTDVEGGRRGSAVASIGEIFTNPSAFVCLVWSAAWSLARRSSPWSEGFFLTDSCALAWLSSKHRWQARRATKPDLSTKNTPAARLYSSRFFLFFFFIF